VPFLTKASMRRSLARVSVAPKVVESLGSTTEHTEVNIADDDTEVAGSCLPRFELIMDNDPVSKKIQDRLYDFQMSRFG
jgi:hypothetical protein